ncbi:MAG: ComF family protein [Alphaproteobacteria bacterium]|nr:ComF family protein [Alphaproteobacteria bacterium]
MARCALTAGSRCISSLIRAAPAAACRLNIPSAKMPYAASACASAPPFSRARACVRYDEHSKRLVLLLKYHDQAYLARIFGSWLAKAGGELIRASDMIIPVPLHYWRFVSRRYNQSALLAAALAKTCGLPHLPDGLTRTRKTLPQTGLSRSQRENNVRGAFAANPKHLATLKGKSVLLMDDVFTTGATIEACTKALLKAGSSTVNVLTLARTA